MDAEQLKRRCAKFIETCHIRKTKFTANIGISPSGYAKWQAGQLTYSFQTLNRIDSYLKQYGY